MNTDQFIQAMAADTRTERPVDTTLPYVLLATTLVFGGMFLYRAGVRPDLAEALTHLNVIVKQVFPLALAVCGLAMVHRLSRPGATLGNWAWGVPIVLGVIAVLIVAQLLMIPSQNWAAAATGSSLVMCITSIPLISLPIAAASLWFLKRGAPTRPGLCGAAAGLMSAGAAATAYAFYCIDDSPLFYGIWYLVGIAFVTLISGLIGAKLLRW